MIRVLLAGLGPEPDQPASGAEVARALRNAGTEVVLVGWDHAVEHVLGIALQEDVDAVGLLQASVAQRQELATGLAAQGAADIAVFALSPDAEDGSGQDGVLSVSCGADAVLRWVSQHVEPGS